MVNKERIIIDIFMAHTDVPFQWGKNDCLIYCAACAKEITGKDPISHLRGKYKTALGAQKVMKKNGWKTLGDVAASIYKGLESTAFLQTGDWAYVINEDGTETLGVVCGSLISAQLEKGVGQVGIKKAVRGFRVE